MPQRRHLPANVLINVRVRMRRAALRLQLRDDGPLRKRAVRERRHVRRPDAGRLRMRVRGGIHREDVRRVRRVSRRELSQRRGAVSRRTTATCVPVRSPTSATCVSTTTRVTRSRVTRAGVGCLATVTLAVSARKVTMACCVNYARRVPGKT